MDYQRQSHSRVETIREGMRCNPAHRPVWIRAAQARIDELEFRKALFELEPFELEELAELQALVPANDHPETSVIVHR
jgi:hypothetical protein